MTIVKIKPEFLEANESADARYVLIEDREDRVLIELICEMNFRPQNCIPKHMIEEV